ncbi:MAG: NAD(P)-dependent oxidoreductase [Paracoccaceae bacterium]
MPKRKIDTRTAIGFIGLGAMGIGMVKNLLNNNIAVSVFDINQEKKTELTALGASFEKDPAAVASKVTKLFLCLPFKPEVDSVLFNDKGVIAGSKSGLMVLDTSTLLSKDSVEISQKLKKVGISYNDAPISGLPYRAQNGSLTVLFGGSKKEFSSFTPYLNIIGNFVLHCGPVGTGQMMKAFNNVLYNINIAGLSEVFPLALKAGLKQSALEKLFTTGSSKSFASEYFIPKMVNRVFTGDYQMTAAVKDIENVKNITEDFEVETPMLDGMVKTYMEAIELGFGTEAKSAMIKVYEKKLRFLLNNS